MKIIPNYHPPQDYRRPTKTQEKVYVPVNDYPEINFSMIANPLTLTNPFLHAFGVRSGSFQHCHGGLRDLVGALHLTISP